MNVLQNIKKGIFQGFGFILVLLVITGMVYAWDGLTATTGDTLTADKWNELVTQVNSQQVLYERCSIASPTKGKSYNCAGAEIGDHGTSDLVNVYCSDGYKVVGGGGQLSGGYQIRQSNTYGDNRWSFSSPDTIAQVTLICLKID